MFFYCFIFPEHPKPKQTPQPKKSAFTYGLMEHFQEEWVEIAVPNVSQKTDSMPAFLSPYLMETCEGCNDDNEEGIPPSPTWALKDTGMSMKGLYSA